MLHLTTNQNKKYWQFRQIDWDRSYLSGTINHPHRGLILEVLKSFNWLSLWEVGCGPGANLFRICQSFPGRQLGGNDLNADAIDLARKSFKNAIFEVSSGDNILMSDKACDVVLSDMMLIYVDPLNIKKYLNEFKRICRTRVILVEFHSESWWERLKLRIRSGYNSYNYKKLLEQVGFYDIIVWKIPEEYWPGGNPQKQFAYIISAKK
jgi:ubiquinone/menaquinone biosynthesis C-methylase UbiE